MDGEEWKVTAGGFLVETGVHGQWILVIQLGVLILRFEHDDEPLS